MRRLLATTWIIAMIAAACASPSSDSTITTTPATTTVAPATSGPPAVPTVEASWPDAPDWALPAIAYLEAYRNAVASADVDELFPFLADGVHWYGGGPGDRLRIGLLDTLNGIEDTPSTVRLPGPFFVEWVPTEGGIGYDIDWVHEALLPPDGCPGADPCRRLQDLHLTVGPQGVAQHRVLEHAADLRADGRAAPADLDRLEARYADIARRLSSRVPEEAAAMMSDVPVWVQGDDGVLERVNPRERWLALFEYLFRAMPDSEVATLTTADLGFPGDPHPAVFFTPGDSVLRFREFTTGGVGVYRQTVAPGQSFLVAFEWFEQATGLVDLDLEIEPLGLALPADDGGLPPMASDPALWPQVPAPSLLLTGTIDIDGDSVLVYNGSAGQQALVEWAIGRYVEAGLPPPIPRSVSFPPSADCVLHAGLAVDTGAGVDIQLCFDDEDACTGEECAPSADARSTLLHELGHVWTVRYLDDAVRSAFLEVRGLEVWSSPDVSRDHLGTEHAAEVLAWALLESDTWPARLPDNECGSLAAAYRILTGRDPPRACPAG